MLKQVFSLVFISLLFNANSQETSIREYSTLDEVLVSATRLTTAINIQDIKKSATIINKNKLEQLQPENITQALRYESNIVIKGGPRGYIQAPSIRGLSGNKVLQVIDGVRQHADLGHRPSYYLDPALIQSIEVIKGPNSSLWGSGAIAGVVSQNTISVKDILTGNQQIGGYISQGYHSNNQQHITNATVAFANQDNVNGLLGGYYRDNKDTQYGNSQYLANSASYSKGLLAKLNWQIDSDQSLQLAFRHSNTNGGVPVNASRIEDARNFAIDRNTINNHAIFNYKLTNNNKWLNANTILYWHDIYTNEYRQTDRRHDTTKITTLGGSFVNFNELNYLTLNYGIDLYQDKLNGFRSGKDRPVVPDAKSQLGGGFIQANIPISQQWQLSVGIRYDYFSTTANNLAKHYNNHAFSPSLAASWLAADWATFTLRRDTAFRAPGIEELYTSGTHFCIPHQGCNVFTPNPNLEPEQAINNELLGSFQFFNDNPQQNLTLTAAFFSNNVSNLIERFTDRLSTSWRNLLNAKLTGFELAGHYKYHSVNISTSYSQVRGIDKATNKALANIPANKLILRVSQSFGQQDWLVGLAASITAPQNRTTTNYIYSGYRLLDLFVSWEPAVGKWKGIKLNFGIDNAFNRHYRYAFEELYQPGRNIKINISYKL